MVVAIGLAIFGFVVAVLFALAAYKWRQRFVPQNWHIFLALGLCGLGVSIFYTARAIDIASGAQHLEVFIFWSRWLWGLVLVILGLTAISALLIPVDKNNV